MAELANKTFFKFLFGFIAIIASSFLVIAVTGYYSDTQSATAIVSEDCENGEDC